MASDYVPPVDDYRFLFGEAFGLDLPARATGGAFKLGRRNIVETLLGSVCRTPYNIQLRFRGNRPWRCGLKPARTA